jgi:hypothetical protein
MRLGSFAPVLVALALCSLAAVQGCSSRFDGQTYRGDGFAFRVAEVPSSWQRVENSERALAWEDRSLGATILANGRCDRDGEDVPLRSLTQHLFIQFSEREVHSEEVLPFDGREALRTDLTAKLDGVELRFLVWVLKKDRCVYDLLYFAPPQRFEQGVAGFDTWARGFSALPREATP